MARPIGPGSSRFAPEAADGVSAHSGDDPSRESFIDSFLKFAPASFERWWRGKGWSRFFFSKSIVRVAYLSGFEIGVRAMLGVQDEALRTRDSDGPRMAETNADSARGEAGPARAEGIANPDPAPSPPGHIKPGGANRGADANATGTGQHDGARQ